jgi:hypothetical protein
MRSHLLCVSRVECAVISVLFASKSLLATGWFEIEARLQESSSSSRPSDLPIEPFVTLATDPPVTADLAINSGYLLVSPIDGAPFLSPHQDSTAEFWPAGKASASRSSESDTLLNRVRVASK